MADPLSTVKSTQSFTLQFVGSTADPCLTKGILNSSPHVLCSGNSFFFNYSHSKNSSDLKFLKLFFDNLSTGNTLAFSGGVYSNIYTGAQTNWNGQFTLQGKTGSYNEFLYFSGLSGTASISSGIYDKNLFTSPVQFSATTGATANILLSKLPDDAPLNLEYLGLYGSDFNFEEYIEVEKSTLNVKRIKVKNAINLNDGSEVVYLDPTDTIANENLYFQNSLVTVYMRGIPNTNIISYDETINGVIKIVADYPGVFSRFIENQNIQQYTLRKLLNSEYSLNYFWYPNTTLKSLNITTLTPTSGAVSLQLTKIYHLVYKTTIVTDFVASADFQVPELQTTTTFNEIVIDNTTTGTLIIPFLSIYDTLNFRIDLSDSRNFGTTINAFADSACSVPLTSKYYLTGTPGVEGAAFLYAGSLLALNTNIYLKLERETTSVLEIVIQTG
jgi:hypothetical protein